MAQILSSVAGWSAEDFSHVHTDHWLDIALQRVGATHLDMLPVVRRDNPRRLVGIVTLSWTSCAPTGLTDSARRITVPSAGAIVCAASSRRALRRQPPTR